MSEKWDQRFLTLAQHVSTWSRDPSTKVGAVITDGKQIVSTGFNGFPRFVKDDHRLENREEKYELVVHAELNALLFAKCDLVGHALYTYPLLPCSRCAGPIIQAGITQVIAPKSCPDRWRASIDRSLSMFHEAAVQVRLVDDSDLQPRIQCNACGGWDCTTYQRQY